MNCPTLTLLDQSRHYHQFIAKEDGGKNVSLNLLYYIQSKHRGYKVQGEQAGGRVPVSDILGLGSDLQH